MRNLLSLPHFSASAERLFSVLNNIKVKNRSSLKTSTINALLNTKGLLVDADCTKWDPLKNYWIEEGKRNYGRNKRCFLNT